MEKQSDIELRSISLQKTELTKAKTKPWLVACLYELSPQFFFFCITGELTVPHRVKQ